MISVNTAWTALWPQRAGQPAWREKPAAAVPIQPDTVHFSGTRDEAPPEAAEVQKAGFWKLEFSPPNRAPVPRTLTLTQVEPDRPKEKKRYQRVLPAHIQGKRLRLYKGAPLRQLFTRNKYLGVAEDFYQAGNRWGVSLGSTPQEFRNSPLCINGKIGLPDGKYLLVVKPDASGQKPGEVILGREARNTHAATLEAFRNGTLAPLDARHLMSIRELDGDTAYTVPARAGQGGLEFLKVPNHSALASRGKPYDPANPQEYAVIFAGEWEIRNGSVIAFHRVNTQSGQFMGPAGTLTPPSAQAGSTPPASLLSDPALHEQVVMSSLLQVSEHLEKLLGLKPGSMDLVNVRFKKGKAASMPQAPFKVTLSVTQAERMQAALNTPTIRTLLENLPEGEAQRRLLLALAYTEPETTQEVLRRIGKYEQNSVLRPGQSASLALQLLEDPSGLEVLSTQPFAKSRPNLVRKLMHGFTAAKQPGLWPAEMSFKAFYEQLSQQQPALLELMGEQRISSSFAVQVLSRPDKLPRLNQYAGLLSQLEQTSPERMPGNADFARNQHFLTTLSAYAFLDEPGQPTGLNRAMTNRLKNYGVALEDLFAFTRERYKARWSNKQIILAYALEHPGLGRFLKHVATGVMPAEE